MNSLAHPHYETPRQRARRLARAEVNRFLDDCDRRRRRWQAARVLAVKH